MARVVRLTGRFRGRLDALGTRSGTRASAAVGATIAALSEAATLPGVLDAIAMIPPTARAFVRRVAGRNLWLWYRVVDDEVVLVTLTNMPPVAAEP